MTGAELLEHWRKLGNKWPKVGPKLARKAARLHQERRTVARRDLGRRRDKIVTKGPGVAGNEGVSR